MKSVKTAVAVTRSAVVGLGSALGALADWAEENAEQAAKVLVWVSAAFCVGFFGTLAVNGSFHSPSRPAEAAVPSTTQAPTVSTSTVTKVIRINQPPTQPEVSHPAEKESKVQTTEASQPPSQESSAQATLPSIPTSESVTPSAPSDPELPSSTTSAPSSSTSSAATAATSSSKAGQ